MPGTSDPVKPQLTAEDAFLDLLVETLENLDRTARGQFLQRYLRAVAQVEFTEAMSLEYWERILARRLELSESLGRPISLKTAMVDVLASSNALRVPILMEYEELKKLQINAATDPLTGLYNRRLFEEYFEKELNRARRYSQNLALVILDLHRFKEVNDRYGHLRGDQVLQVAAASLRKSLRTSDYAFRIGGDEFALLLPQSDAEQASALCRRMRSVYQGEIQPMGLEVPVGLDFGLAVHPADGDQKEALIRLADRRLYQQKEAHRLAAEPAPISPPAREARAVPITPAPAPTTPPAPPQPAGIERRKWERVLLTGTRAYAQLEEKPERTVRVLDLGYGGVALEIESASGLNGSFQAILHVPILPPVRVSLRRVYLKPGVGNVLRLGCAFVT